MIFETHAHYDDEKFDEDRAELLSSMQENGIGRIINVSANLESLENTRKLMEVYPFIYGAFGLHPDEVGDLNEDVMARMRELCRMEKAVAVGEIGLDYYWDKENHEKQEYWFRRQIRLANELRLPIVIHSRDADQRTMDILKEENAFSAERCSWFPKRRGPGGALEKDARVLLHCFSGSRELGQQYVRLGATLSVAGPVTYKNNRRTVEMVEAIPIEYLLAETDAPYLTPVPFRGKPNKSPYVEYTVRKMAEIKGISYEETARKTLENAKAFFDIE